MHQAYKSIEKRSSERPETSCMVEEVLPDGTSCFHTALNLTERGALLVTADDGITPWDELPRYSWFRIDLPFEADYVPVLGEIVRERWSGTLRFRHVRFKHLFPDGQGAIDFHVARARGGL